MNHLKNLYRDTVILFTFFLLGLGVSHLAQFGLANNAYLFELCECFIMCASIAVPFTLYRLFTGSRFATDTKLGAETTTALLVCILIVYASFGFMKTVLIPTF